MRETKELLELMLKKRYLFERGLCNWVFDLVCMEFITYEEGKHLLKYIKQNKPSIFSSFHRLSISAYYWKKGDIKPRIKWIEEHIKKLS